MKKVLLMLTALSMMAMLGACKSSDDDDDDGSGNSIETQAKKFAKKMCECEYPNDCYDKINGEIQKYYDELDEVGKVQFDSIYSIAMRKCQEGKK